MRLALLAEQNAGTVSSTIVFRQTPAGPAVLITQRTRPPSAGGWCLPGGHCRSDESPEECARRELAEETGLTVGNLNWLGCASGTPGRCRAENIFFATDLQNRRPVQSGSDASAIRWVPISRLPALLFGHGSYVIDVAEKLLGESATLSSVLAPLCGPLVEDINMSVRSLTDRLTYSTAPTTAGILIVFEGIDGAGKSSQVIKLEKKLQRQDLDVTTTKWNSSPLLHDAIKQAKDQHLLTPMLYSVMHAADMLLRYDADIVPALNDDKIVICDRYLYTSLARDRTRGIDPNILYRIYDGMRPPDILFHCYLPVAVAAQRLKRRGGLSYYGSGLDCRFHPDKHKNAVLYAEALDRAYHDILPQQSGYHKIDMNRSINDIAAEIWKIIQEVLGERWRRKLLK